MPQYQTKRWKRSEQARRCIVNTEPGNGATVCVGQNPHRADFDDNMRLLADAPEFRDMLQELADWMREHTGPHDPNSPHEMLVRAVALLARGAS